MSLITLIVVEGRRIHYVQTHWRTVQALLAHGFAGVFWHRHEQTWTDTLDAGYILVDLNRNVLVNGQEAFALNTRKIDKELPQFSLHE